MQTLSSTKTQSWLIWFLRGFLILGFVILIGRLIDLQVIRGRYYKVLAEENRIRRIPISAARGKIIARGGEILVDNKEVKKKISLDALSGIKKHVIEDSTDSEGVIKEPTRDYILGSDFAHVSGYLGEVNEEELGKVEAECNEKGPKKIMEFSGRSGLEEEYNCFLSGIDGEELVEVDALGNEVRVLGQKKPIQGNDLKTTIDYGLQKKVSELMRGIKGAVVVTDRSGEVLALYSAPSYDPNLFVDGDQEKIAALFQDKNLPLFNRVIGGIFHPGSTFKPIVATAALEEDVIDKDFIFEDTGAITVKTLYGSFSYTNWYFNQYGGVEGKINLERALARSTDTFFYKIGEMVGVEKLDEWGDKFYLDKKTGIDLPGEVAGLVPSPEWKIKVKGERWFLGNTYHMSIGQGDIALTPLEVNQAIAAIANDGVYCQPHIVSGEESKKFPSKSEIPHGEKCEDLGIKRENIDLVKKGMIGVCSAGGTGFTFFDFKEKTQIDVACKTGTAELEGNLNPHAWFTAFAPADIDASEDKSASESQIIATVLVENGGEGSKVAGPIAREIFNYWFKVPVTPTPAHD